MLYVATVVEFVFAYIVLVVMSFSIVSSVAVSSADPISGILSTALLSIISCY